MTRFRSCRLNHSDALVDVRISLLTLGMKVKEKDNFCHCDPHKRQIVTGFMLTALEANKIPFSQDKALDYNFLIWVRSPLSDTWRDMCNLEKVSDGQVPATFQLQNSLIRFKNLRPYIGHRGTDSQICKSCQQIQFCYQICHCVPYLTECLCYADNLHIQRSTHSLSRAWSWLWRLMLEIQKRTAQNSRTNKSNQANSGSWEETWRISWHWISMQTISHQRLQVRSFKEEAFSLSLLSRVQTCICRIAR